MPVYVEFMYLVFTRMPGYVEFMYKALCTRPYAQGTRGTSTGGVYAALRLLACQVVWSLYLA